MIGRILKYAKDNVSTVLLHVIVVSGMFISGFSLKVSFSVVGQMHARAATNLYSAFNNNVLEKADFIAQLKATSSASMDIYYILFAANIMVVFLFVLALQVSLSFKLNTVEIDFKKAAFYIKNPKLSARLGAAVISFLVLLVGLVAYMVVSKFCFQWNLSLWQVNLITVLTLLISILYPIYERVKFFTVKTRLSQNEI